MKQSASNILNNSRSHLETEDLLNYIKNGHTVSFDGHLRTATPMLHSRSSALLASRGPSYPCMSLDLSVDVTEENLFRRSAHQELLSRNPSCFHRKRTEESPSTDLLQMKEMKDLLGTMHPVKDFNDIDRAKTARLTLSRRSAENKKEKDFLDEYHFENMTPLEDFVRPGSTEAPRNTGYESGHIRSLFKLDTYGPTQSRARSRQLSREHLPSGNVDRYARLSPDHHLNLSGTHGSIGSQERSRSNSPAGSRSSVDSHRSTATPGSYRSAGGNTLNDTNLDLTIPSSLRKVKENFGQTRITLEDRLSKDPFVRRKQFDVNHKRMHQTRSKQQDYSKRVSDYKKKQQEIADIERRRIRKFEQNLILARFEA